MRSVRSFTVFLNIEVVLDVYIHCRDERSNDVEYINIIPCNTNTFSANDISYLYVMNSKKKIGGHYACI